MKLNLSHPFLWVILVVTSLSISQILRSVHGSLVTTVLYIAYGLVWAPLISLAKDYLDNLDNREEDLNV